jgi:hypothetical protein
MDFGDDLSSFLGRLLEMTTIREDLRLMFAVVELGATQRYVIPTYCTETVVLYLT